MLGLSTLGTVHTAISLVALAAGLIALVRDKQIVSGNSLGRLYVIATALTCLTGFGIFNHGGFGKPHVLGIVTLLVLALAWAAGRGMFGAAARYVEVLGYSTTFFFHMIPGVTETGIRLPAGKPLFSSPEDPALQPVAGVLFLLLLIGGTLQVLRLRREQRSTASVLA